MVSSSIRAPRSIRRTGGLLLLAVLASPFDALHAAPHGGVYRGPGSGIPAGGTPAGVPTPGSGAPAPAQAVASDWRTWWSFNRDPFLELRAAIHAEAPTTGSGDYSVGQGERELTHVSSRPSTEEIDELVLPALVRALALERSDDVRSGALLALAKIGHGPPGTRLADLVRPLLDDPSQEISETAAVALGVAADPSSAPLLASLLADTAEGRRLVGGKTEVPYRTRAFAAYGLGLIASRTDNEDVRRFVVHHLVRALDDRSMTATRDVHVACVLTLGIVPIARAPERSRGANDEEDRAAPPSGSREALVDYLAELLDDRTRHELVRAHAPVALARHVQGLDAERFERVVRALGKLLARGSDAHTAVQQGAISALALLGDNDRDELDRFVRKSLHAAYDHGDRTARHLAMLALGRVAARDGAGEGAEEGLGEVRTFLLRKVASGSTVERPWAALALGVLERTRQDRRLASPPEIAQAVRASIASRQSPIEVGAYLLAAGLVRDLDAREALLERVRDESDDETRGYACLGLGLLGERDVLPELREVVRDSRYRPGVLRDAAVALGLLGDRQTVPLLIEMLGEVRGLAATAAVTSALGFVGDRRALAPLVAMIDDPDTNDRTRAFAAVALGLICDKEPLPWNSKLAVDVTFWSPPGTLFDPGGGKGILDLL